MSARASAKLPPGPRAPAAVNMARLVERPLESLLGWRERYGDVFTVQLLSSASASTSADRGDPRDASPATSPTFSPARPTRPSRPSSARSVLVLDGPEHLRQRKLLLPPFQGPRWQGFRDGDPRGRRGRGRRLAGRRAVVMRERMRALTFEVICPRGLRGHRRRRGSSGCERARGGDRDADDLRAARAPCVATSGDGARGASFERRLPGRRRADYEEIARRRRRPTSRSAPTSSRCCWARATRTGEPMTDVELRDELMTMLLAGHETTATRPRLRLRPAAAQPARAGSPARRARRRR